MAPTDRRKPGPEGEAQQAPEDSGPPELSSRGKVVVRSSSHPPGADYPITDPPPPEVLAVAEALREKKDTPADSPRGRRKVQAKRLSEEIAAVAAREAEEAAARESEWREINRMRDQDRRLWWVVIGAAVLVGALYWFSR